MDDSALYCNLGAIPAAERERHGAMAGRIFESVTAREEVEAGYRYRLPLERWPDVAAWALLERLCCPFFRFQLDLLPDGTFWLALTGPEGVKALLRAELGIV